MSLLQYGGGIHIENCNKLNTDSIMLHKNYAMNGGGLSILGS